MKEPSGPEGNDPRKLWDDVGGHLKEAVDELDRALTAVGNTLRDPETRDSVKRAARSFGDALSTTFADLGDEIRKALKGKGSGPDTPAGSS